MQLGGIKQSLDQEEVLSVLERSRATSALGRVGGLSDSPRKATDPKVDALKSPHAGRPKDSKGKKGAVDGND